MKFRTRDTTKIFWQHAKPYSAALIMVVVSVIAAVAFELYRPILYKQFFDILATGDRANTAALQSIVVMIGITAVLSWFFWRLATFMDIFFAARVMTNLSNTSFKYLHGHSYAFFNNTFVGSLVRKVNRYTRAFEDITDQFVWNMGPALITMVFITVVLWMREPFLAILILLWTVIYLILNYAFILYKLRFDIARAEADTKASGHLADTITNHLNVKLFGAFESEFKAYKKLTEKLYHLRRFTWNLDEVSHAIQGGMMVILEVVVMYTAITYWERGVLTIGDFALIQAFLIRMFYSLWNVGKHIRRIYEGLADAQEMTEILTEKHQVVDVPGASELKVQKGEIVFDHVQFAYTVDQVVFNDFGLTIDAGEKVALVGQSGSGKSTITKMLLRFFDINKGRILIDQQDIKAVTQDSLRDAVALVPQEPILFHRSLIENIRYAKPEASDAEVIKAAKLAHCHEFIMGFPEQYQTYVGERGVKLSGGERQRVAIARAILKDAPILILDEATSSLDSESERYIQDALKTLMKNRTTIVIAHRLSTIMLMDRIVVLENGTILEQGEHEELLKAKQGKYQKLWQIQAGGFQ